jgi:hypothetical protein
MFHDRHAPLLLALALVALLLPLRATAVHAQLEAAPPSERQAQEAARKADQADEAANAELRKLQAARRAAMRAEKDDAHPDAETDPGDLDLGDDLDDLDDLGDDVDDLDDLSSPSDTDPGDDDGDDEDSSLSSRDGGSQAATPDDLDLDSDLDTSAQADFDAGSAGFYAATDPAADAGPSHAIEIYRAVERSIQESGDLDIGFAGDVTGLLDMQGLGRGDLGGTARTGARGGLDELDGSDD